MLFQQVFIWKNSPCERPLSSTSILLLPLSDLKKGERAKIVSLCQTPQGEKLEHVSSCLPIEELERRLLEMGFVEGSEVSIVHEGPFARDPVAVLIKNSFLVAIRRQEEGRAILVRKI
jgi:ferrous iron transport protein A